MFLAPTKGFFTCTSKAPAGSATVAAAGTPQPTPLISTESLTTNGATTELRDVSVGAAEADGPSDTAASPNAAAALRRRMARCAEHKSGPAACATCLRTGLRRPV